MPSPRSTTDELLVAVRDGVAEITLNRPDARNAVTPVLRDELLQVLRDARADTGVRAVLLTGAGPGFCAGMDLSASAAATAGRPDHDPRQIAQNLYAGMQQILQALWELDKPTVAAVNGAAVGPGAHLALACDFVLTQAATRFLWTFSKVGLVADVGGAWLLPRLVGLPRARAMIMLGEAVGGAEAVQVGLAYRHVDDALEEGRALAARLAAGPTRAIGMSKRLLNGAFEASLAQSFELEGAYQSLATTTADLVEGLTAARERREPEFQGR